MAISGTSSGGYFNNRWYNISKFASDLQLEINTETQGINIEGCTLPAKKFSLQTLSKIQALQQLIEVAGLVAMEIEILYSNGQGETNFNMLVDGLLNKYTQTADAKNKEQK